jgi:hypothetical protein
MIGITPQPNFMQRLRSAPRSPAFTGQAAATGRPS